MNEVLQALLDLMKNNAGLTGDEAYCKFFYGKNVVPAQANFPLLEVYPNNSDSAARGTGSRPVVGLIPGRGGLRTNTFSITVRIQDTLKSNLSETRDKEVITSYDKTIKRMEGTENGDYLDGSIMKILTENLTISDTIKFADNFQIEYDSVGDLNGSYIVSASVTFEATIIKTC